MWGQPPLHTERTEVKPSQRVVLTSHNSGKKGLQYIIIKQAHLAPCTKLYQSLNEQIFGFANEKKIPIKFSVYLTTCQFYCNNF